MDAYEKYFFDINGYVVVEDMLTAEEVAALNEAIDHNFQDGRMWNGLMAVCYQLTDVNPGEGGYACIPGSHRANYPCPDDVRRLEAHPEWFKHLPMKAGSALIFTEALTHGTLPWKGSHERRTLLYRYGTGHMVYGSGPSPRRLRVV